MGVCTVNLPRGSKSPAVTQPRWYVRRLAQRPAGIRSRGPWAPLHPKVEDAERLDAHELWEQADPRGRFDAGKAVVRAGPRVRYLPVGDLYRRGATDPPAGWIEVRNVLLKLTRGARYFHTRKHRVNVVCPACERRFRYLYPADRNPLPRCRDCAGLIYRSQARSRAARYRTMWERAKDWGFHPTPKNLARRQRLWDSNRIPDTFIRRLRAERERWELYREWDADGASQEQRGAERRQEGEARRERERDCRQHIRAVWRAYLDGLSSRRLKDMARNFRWAVRRFAGGGSPEGDPVREPMARFIEQLGAMLPDFPSEVFQFDLAGGAVPLGDGYEKGATAGLWAANRRALAPPRK